MMVKPTNGPPYYTGLKSVSKKKLKLSNFIFKKWYRAGLYRSERFFVDVKKFYWGEFPSYKYT